MGQTQCCYVCGTWDELVVSRISVQANDSYPPRMVGQCPRCRRFICTDHGEKLDLSPRKFWRFFGGSKEKHAIDLILSQGAVLEGYEKSMIGISGRIYPIASPRKESVVEGTVLTITIEELKRIDGYETSAYVRREVTLRSGKRAWVYQRP